MTPAGAAQGAGEPAEAFTERSTPGFKRAEYMVHARTGNLPVKVWLTVGGDEYVSSSVLGHESDGHPACDAGRRLDQAVRPDRRAVALLPLSKDHQ
ncbi:hypothetical protein [Micromonospora antibiotica]|uniref:Uncharacterized protein n=1 Tax=Micromonospora antibiotica TaxID=2807623 RepID=A0ABS3V789_9ACTN|nr:hypothetical protein [Micromonospora antibiotica]MBO4161479.1 hypothetical protein [Micromonospora antibiotica]